MIIQHIINESVYNCSLIKKEDIPQNVFDNLEMLSWQSVLRRPVYKLRGNPISREQAYEIIRRTDNYLGYRIKEPNMSKDYIGNINFNS